MTGKLITLIIMYLTIELVLFRTNNLRVALRYSMMPSQSPSLVI
jgi:hypothetical protein